MYNPWSINIHEGKLVEGKIIEQMGQPEVNPENGNLLAVPVELKSSDSTGEKTYEIVVFDEVDPHCYELESEETKEAIENSAQVPEIVIHMGKVLIVRVFLKGGSKEVKIDLE